MDDTTRPPRGMPGLQSRRFGRISPLTCPLAPLTVAAAVLASGCMESPTPGPRPQRPVSLDEAIQQQTQPRISAPALVNGDPVSWNELRPRLAEVAGRLVLEEVALERLLEEALASRGGSLSPADITREREILLGTVDPEGTRDRDQRLQLLEAVRVRRGLGEQRLDGMLKRSAMLRKLVADRVEVNEQMVRQRYETLYGEQYVVRAIILPTEGDAAGALRDLYAASPEAGAEGGEGAEGVERDEGGERGEGGEGAGAEEADPQRPAQIDAAALRARFIDLAIQRSIDPSGDRGGLLEPISPADPTYPRALRESLREMAPGEVAGPLAIDGAGDATSFALLLLQERLPPEPVPLEEVRETIRQELQQRQERILMGELAERLLDSAEIRPLHDSLRWSWEARER